MWVTMKDDGPRIANIALDGVYNENVVTKVPLQAPRKQANEQACQPEEVKQ